MTAEARAPFVPPEGNPRFPLFDGLRAIAATAVVVGHTAAAAQTKETWWGAMPLRFNAGVTVFFLISGFLLYRPYVRARRSGEAAPSTRIYLRRRALRILPAYWTALTLLAIWPGLEGAFSADFWRYYLFLQVYDLDTFLLGLPPAWTLCVEATFYLSLPLLARAIGAAAGRRTTTELALLLGAGAASVTFHAVVQHQTAADNIAYSILGLFGWFSLGMTLAVMSVSAQEGEPSRIAAWARARPGSCWLAAAAAYLLACYGIGLPAMPTFPPPDLSLAQVAAEHVLYALTAFLLLLPAVFDDGRRGVPHAILGHPAVAWSGVVSYGVFLWHYPVLFELVEHGALGWIPGAPFIGLTVTTLAISLVCGCLSYYVVERPALRRKNRLGAGRRPREPVMAPEA